MPIYKITPKRQKIIAAMPSIKIKDLKEQLKNFLSQECGWGGTVEIDCVTLKVSEQALSAIADAAIAQCIKILLVAQGSTLEQGLSTIHADEIESAISRLAKLNM